ncbi:MAG: Rpp14/Pop5 family protein [Candidatus Micrarchaeaceae archaeon]
MIREKRRYMLVETTIDIADGARKDFENALLKELVHNIGEVGYFRTNPKIIRFLSSRRFILKCSLAKYKDTTVALTFIKRVGGASAAFYTLNASGTIKALLKE